MYQRFLWLFIFTVFFAHTLIAGDNSWQNLFNGKDLSGWKVLNGAAEYRVEDGAIVGESRVNTPNTFLVTEQTFSDFILEYEARLDGDMNSGVQIRSSSTTDYQGGRVHGYQIELDPSAREWTGGLYDEARRGWLYNLECNPQAKKAYKPNGWNNFRVEATGNHIRVWLNDIPTVDFIDEITESGFIGLQVHSIGNDKSKEGITVRFQNIRIKTQNLAESVKPEDISIPQISFLKNELTPHEKAEGWELLWDGKSTKGWHGARLDEFPSEGWKIEDGILTVMANDGKESANGGDIVTQEKYSNFILEVDFKLTKGSNSGIKYFVDTDLNKGPGSSIGCEYQLLDDENHPDAKLGVNGNRTLASLYDLIPANALFYAPNESTSKRVNADGWNRAKIVSQNGHVEHYLNGIKVVQYERGTQMWRALVAYSKYKDWPDFGELPEGNILLQDHGCEVSFKNIKIKVLD